jgi:Ca2+-binding EF-hand superfamily protein
MLQIFDRGGEGKVSQADTAKALYHTLAVPPEEAQRVFRQIDTTGRGYITFGKYELRCIFFFWFGSQC